MKMKKMMKDIKVVADKEFSVNNNDLIKLF